MSDHHESIKRVIEAFERSDWAEIDVRLGDVRVHLAAGEPTDSPGATAMAPPAHASSDGDPAAAAPEPHGASSAAPPAGAHVVVSPSPGIFWRSPMPGAPPFADVGETIDAAATVCIIEVMKLMNHLKAGVSGEVVAVYGRNGVAVGKGEPLFAIAPIEASS